MERVKRIGGRLKQWMGRLLPQNRLTRRWLRNAFCLIVLFLLLLQVLFTAMLHYYYYQSVENALTSRAQLYQRTLQLSTSPDASSWGSRSRALIAYFTDKDKVELQVLDTKGQILLSSSGFVPDEVDTLPDFAQAQIAADGYGVWRGNSATGEPVMALTCMEIGADGQPVGALRYVVSLIPVNRQIWLLSALLFIFILLIIIFVSLSGMYFINSIVAPVTELSRTARRIAMGEYDVRLRTRYNDEIGDLCDTIHFMAGEIAAAERMKNEFISSVSHELRTPLTAITGWTETLQATADDRELTAQGLAIIGGEARRLTGIVEELLDFSRMESGHMALHRQRLDVAAELEEAVFLFRDRAKRKGVTLEHYGGGDPLPVWGDPDRIKQVFINLLDNAVKYSRSGDRVRVETASLPQGVQIVISDTGMGISPEDLTRIRQKFYQADPLSPGAGIGLAVAEEIVQLHGGTLEIDSEPEVGTAVTVLLPWMAQDTQATP